MEAKLCLGKGPLESTVSVLLVGGTRASSVRSVTLHCVTEVPELAVGCVSGWAIERGRWMGGGSSTSEGQEDVARGTDQQHRGLVEQAHRERRARQTGLRQVRGLPRLCGARRGEREDREGEEERRREDRGLKVVAAHGRCQRGVGIGGKVGMVWLDEVLVGRGVGGTRAGTV